MITYHKFCEIRLLREKENFSNAQIARHIGVNEKTVRRWLALPCYSQRTSVPRESILTPYKTLLKRWLDQADFTGVQLLQKLRDAGYKGSRTVLTDYLRLIRPAQHRAYRTLTFAPGEAAQVDWGTYQSIQIGSTRRKLSFLTVVLCSSRMLYVEFFLQERMEHFLAGLQNAFAWYGAVPRQLIVDNMKCAVYDHRPGAEPVFNPRFIDFLNHYGTSARACNPRRPNEKGQVESGVGYVKGNLLHGKDLNLLPAADPLGAMNAQARAWMDTIANVREHWELKKRPIDLFDSDQFNMRPLNVVPYDTGVTTSARVSNRCRVHCDANYYSVPPRFASRKVNLHTYHDRLCIYYQSELIAAHVRSYDRHQPIIDPEHERELLEEFNQKKQAAVLVRFQELDPAAPAFLAQMRQTRFGFMQHVRRILALADIHGHIAVAEALRIAQEVQAYSAESVLNIIERRQRQRNETTQVGQISATTQTQPLLELRLPRPDLTQY